EFSSGNKRRRRGHYHCFSGWQRKNAPGNVYQRKNSVILFFRPMSARLVCVLLISLLSVGAAADDGAWLEKAAEQAVITGKYPRAVSLLRGLAALRPRDPSPIYRLAEVYTLAGQYEEAIVEYRSFAERKEADPARKARAESEAKRLEEAPAPFS